MEGELFVPDPGDDQTFATEIRLDPDTCARGLAHLAALRRTLADYRHQRHPSPPPDRP